MDRPRPTIILPGHVPHFDPDAPLGGGNFLCDVCGEREKAVLMTVNWDGEPISPTDNIGVCGRCRAFLPLSVILYCYAYMCRNGKPHPRIHDLHRKGILELKKSNERKRVSQASIAS